MRVVPLTFSHIYAPGNSSLKFYFVMNGPLTGSFNLSTAITQDDTLTYGLLLYIEKLKLLCKQYPSIHCILNYIIDCDIDEHAVECIIDDATNAFLGRGSLQSRGRTSKG